MAAYNGTAMAAGALSKAIGDSFTPLLHAAPIAEDIRRQRVAESLALAQAAMSQQLQPYRLQEAEGKAAMLPWQQRLAKIKTQTAERGQGFQYGPNVGYLTPTGGFTQAGSLPISEKEQTTDALSALKLKVAQEQQTKQAGMRASWDEMRAKYPQGVPIDKINDWAHTHLLDLDHDSMLGKYLLEELKQGGKSPLTTHTKEALEWKFGTTQGITDPKTIAETVSSYAKFKATNSAGAGAGGIDFTPKSLEMYATSVADGAPMPALGMGKASTEARIKIGNRAAEIMEERGDVGGSLAIRQANFNANRGALAKITTQEAQIAPFSKTANDSLQRAAELSAKIDRSGTPVLNRWLLAGRKSVQGDADVAAFDYHLRLGINEVAKITSSATGGGGVVSDTARREIEDTLSRSMTHQQIMSVIEGARFEMDSRLRHIADQKTELQRAIGGPKGPAPEILKRSDPRYQQLRGRGLTDQQIEQQFGVKVDD